MSPPPLSPGSEPGKPAPEPVRVPLGKPALRRTPADLDRLSRITPEDIAAARDAWQRHAPPGYAGLLDAEIEPTNRAGES